ncbi:hypothetical protein SDC9_154303 [bioreactor metagenome]|uniref:Uncharacterized protein n=1 Tax=bioreactor metagenome TaxID=1076179 RepID=A0A645F369_9ZZZZ
MHIEGTRHIFQFHLLNHCFILIASIIHQDVEMAEVLNDRLCELLMSVPISDIKLIMMCTLTQALTRLDEFLLSPSYKYDCCT